MRCWLLQRLITRRLDDDAGLPPWLERHLAQCPRCRGRYERERALVAQLQAEAAAARRTPPPFLQAHIRARLASATAPAQPAWRAWAWRWAAGVAGVAGAAALLLIFTQSSSPPESEKMQALAQLQADLQTVLAPWPRSDVMVALGERMEAPLRGEWTRMVSDARSALTGLSRSFLPSVVADSPP